MTIAFKELWGSPQERYGANGITAHRRVICAWNDRLALVTELLGDGYEFGGVLRAPYPENSGLVAMDVNIQPFHPRPAEQGAFTDIENEINEYTATGQFAQVDIDYELLVDSLYGGGQQRPDMPTPEPDTILTYQMNLSGEFLKISGATMYWEAAGGGVGDAITEHPDVTDKLQISTSEHRLTWHRAVYPPWYAISQIKGCINRYPFCGYAAETVLFEGSTHDMEFTTFNGAGQTLWAHRMTYLFKEKTHTNFRPIYNPQTEESKQIMGWNHVYRSRPLLDAGWTRVLNHFGRPMYRLADFADLFRYEQPA